MHQLPNHMPQKVLGVPLSYIVRIQYPIIAGRGRRVAYCGRKQVLVQTLEHCSTPPGVPN